MAKKTPPGSRPSVTSSNAIVASATTRAAPVGRDQERQGVQHATEERARPCDRPRAGTGCRARSGLRYRNRPLGEGHADAPRPMAVASPAKNAMCGWWVASATAKTGASGGQRPRRSGRSSAGCARLQQETTARPVAGTVGPACGWSRQDSSLIQNENLPFRMCVTGRRGPAIPGQCPRSARARQWGPRFPRIPGPDGAGNDGAGFWR